MTRPSEASENGEPPGLRPDEELRDLLATVGHELRAPLTTIAGYAQLGLLGGLDDRQALHRAMTRVQAEARRMAALVDELLLFSTLGERRPLECVPVDLAELCAELVADTQVSHPGRPVALVVDEGRHLVRGDPHRLRQVLINLLVNVHHHTPPGTRTEVRLRHEADWACVDVADDGPGIPPGLHERVFEPFFRARRSPAGHEDGSGPRGAAPGGGLGLSLVAALVEAHGGTVRIAPSDKGARFTVRLPARPPIESRGDSDRTLRSIPDRP
ncbi:HAMP domain-containing sensor histidine kinase [Kitasatospora sp. NPDC097691]|uniref:sensor histidine kinase n=1 Tax=Kitasatospora sp. NPDC097691 TaxID=3157231 RepID=UPI003319119A